ncbi:JAB domain-containing protein [Novosphingobium mangrovi (ex Huang et al. 2023)]|uniref:JAB domain-containing protein n=1 Tax=Novosphingobium mangrovi (ex Huang et al. 2023) TaxID=2976432 RepID=A0ABT2I215_9SPHN|nr:JAB domain-containing protein [Novosphingobium mangrovi (ex Huang et al. 2023)]MCT2398845.1 JAB domain-containing protein [Novosphingobium mangrovi (ex Huang et al. 2023)]
MGGLRSEIMLEVLFDARGNLCGYQARCEGRVGAISARYRQLFEYAFRMKAAGFVLVHNHPSGDSRPSVQDIAATRALAAVARAMDVEFFDHVIVGGRAAVSMKRAGLIPGARV